MTAHRELVQTGIHGLDEILAGGFPASRLYLVQGDPGAGKTTLALQFLIAGRDRGERVLYVALSETLEEVRSAAASHGWTLEGLDVYEMSADEALSPPDAENTLYVPAEVELGERIVALLSEVERVNPTRVVVDSCSELRLLAQTPLRFRRQIVAFKRRIVSRGCTLMLIDNPQSPVGDVLLQSFVHGVLHLEQLSPTYGAERRRMRILKLREVRFRGGWHDFVIAPEGLQVFPRLAPSDVLADHPTERLSSGVAELDVLLGGGLDRGTTYLFMGPAGAGKSAIANQYVLASAQRGEAVQMFVFDEGLKTLLDRADAIGMPLRAPLAQGLVSIKPIDPAEMSPGQFCALVREAVEQRDVKMLVIDSLNGYLHAMPEEQALIIQLHELVSYLRQRGVVTVMVVAQNGLLGASMKSPVDVSYLADGVVLFRYLEADGRVRKAISVVKKRSGWHEDTIREFSLGAEGVKVGPPLDNFHGVLTGVPRLKGSVYGEDPREG